MLKLTRTGLGLLTRQYRSVLKKCWAINVGIFALGAALMPSEAEAGVLCYASDGTVKYSPSSNTCPDGTTYILMSLNRIESTATIGSYSTALGNLAQASGDYSVALGYYANASGWRSTALGGSAQASGVDSVALGGGAKATGEGSIAIGSKSVADEANIVSLGHWGAGSAVLANMKNAIDFGVSESSFISMYSEFNANGQAERLYIRYKMGSPWEEAVKGSDIAEILHRITYVADAINEHDAVTLGQLQNNYYTKYGLSGKKQLSSLAVCGASPRQGILSFGVAASISDIALRKGQIAGRSDAQRTSSDDNIGFAAANDNATITTIAA